MASLSAWFFPSTLFRCVFTHLLTCSPAEAAADGVGPCCRCQAECSALRGEGACTPQRQKRVRLQYKWLQPFEAE